MTDRLIDLADEPVRLHIRGELLVISHPPPDDAGNDDKPPEANAVADVPRRRGVRGARQAALTPVETTVPLNEIAAVVASHPQVTLSHAVLARLAGAGATFLACDAKHQPAALMLPLEGHFVQAERFARQADAPLPLRKRLWKQVVQSKLQAQARLLAELRGDDAGISALVERVRSGDPDNIEALASRRYWDALFPDFDFTRVRDGGGPNPLLNYGYAVLRAVVARAVCAAGLHPSLGLHHHNRYDAFCLASDLMEPFRPLVDRAVVALCSEHGPNCPLNRAAKTVLLDAFTARVSIGGESRTVFDAAARMASCLAAVFDGSRASLIMPDA